MYGESIVRIFNRNCIKPQHTGAFLVAAPPMRAAPKLAIPFD
jgi:hypothetical protein